MDDRGFRSPVPDLLYEDQAEERVREISPLLEDPHAIDERFPLHRLTVFVTYRCNLACPYCKTIVRDRSELEALPQRAEVCSLERFASMLEKYSSAEIRHLHFTGGEAALHPDLPAMVALAKKRGIRAVSLTSNGTQPPETYRSLGLDELRISIDAADARLGLLLTQRRRAWETSLATLRALGSAPDRTFTLIANIVVGRANRAALAEIVRLLLDAGADDLKLITEVDERDRLFDFPERDEVLAKIGAMLAERPPGSCPLLRRKLRTVFATDAIGLDSLPDEEFRCYIPLTERTADAVYYYPCSVYLREGGAPLGRVDEPNVVQLKKSADFVARGDCMQDPICRRYCLACTRAYNIRANEARRAVIYFLLVTPLGYPRRDELCAALGEEGIAITAREPLTSWARRATAVYSKDRDPGALERAQRYEEVWSGYADHAELVKLAGAEDHRRLVAIKRELRRRFSSKSVDGLKIHAFHVPDVEDVQDELEALERP